MHKPTKGEELIKRIQDNILAKDVSSNIKPEKDDPGSSNDFVGTARDGVEVIDVKLIPKEEGLQKERKTWDKM